MNKKNKNSNFISIIVPVYNEENNIRFLIKRLLNLNFPKDKYEIIVVDNNSKDDTPEIIKKYKVIYLNEKKQSSYATRNRGAKKAKGNILAFIDGDCVPDKEWLKNANTHFINNKNVDIIAGDITLSINYSIPLKLIDIYQLITMGERQRNSEKEGKCSGGNLIVKRKIFEKIGYFDKRLISGGDGEWTKRATQYGFKIRYYEDVKIYHPPEGFFSLFKRSIRIGYGIAQIHYLLHRSFNLSALDDNRSKNIIHRGLEIYYRSIRLFWNSYKQGKINKGKLLLLIFLSILLKSVLFYGIVKGILFSKLHRKFE